MRTLALLVAFAGACGGSAGQHPAAETAPEPPRAATVPPADAGPTPFRETTGELVPEQQGEPPPDTVRIHIVSVTNPDRGGWMRRALRARTRPLHECYAPYLEANDTLAIDFEALIVMNAEGTVTTAAVTKTNHEPIVKCAEAALLSMAIGGVDELVEVRFRVELRPPGVHRKSPWER